MKKVVFPFLFVTFFWLTFVSCDKDNGDGNNVAAVKLLSSIVKHDGDYQKFEYDSEHRISKILWYVNGETTPRWSDTYTYSGNNIKRVSVEAEYPDGGTTNEFIKSGNTVTSKWWYNSDPADVRTGNTFTLTGDGLLSKVVSAILDLVFESSFQYQGGNLTTWMSKEELFEETTNEGVTTFKYDAKNAPFVNCQTPKWLLVWLFDYEIGIHNNAIEMSLLNDAGDESKLFFAYEYDDDGYPTKKTSSYTEGVFEDTWVTRFTYNK